MTAIKLNELPCEETYVYLDKDYKNELLNRAIQKAGSQSKLANQLNRTKWNIIIKQVIISAWLKKKNIRLDVLFWICDYLSTFLDLNKIKAIKGAGTSKYIYNPKLPIEFTADFASVLAKIYCDGTIDPNNSYTAAYHNTNNELLSEFISNFKACFGDTEFYESKIGNVTRVRIPGLIGRLLYEKFLLYKNRVPDTVMKANLPIKTRYLRAVFDDEGTIHRGHGQIRLKMKHKSFVKDISELLRELKIETSKIAKESSKYRLGDNTYYFTISCRHNLETFDRNIGFTHPRKKRILKNRLKTYKCASYGYNANHRVLRLLKSEGPITVRELAIMLKRDRRTIQMHLTNLKKKGLVQYSKTKKRNCYEFIWKTT